MCVIMVVKDKAPTLEQLIQAEEVNGDGAGIAWLQGGKVHWKKSLTARGVYKIMKSVPKPSVIHFRLATAGNNKILCHPFGIDEKVSSSFFGKSDRVLFHNGHWGQWETHWEAVNNARLKIPPGLYSDSRLIAYLAFLNGSKYPQFLEKVDGMQKFCVLDKNGPKTYGGGWVEIDGFLCSNDHWTRRTWMYTPRADNPKWWQDPDYDMPPHNHGVRGGKIAQGSCTVPKEEQRRGDNCPEPEESAPATSPAPYFPAITTALPPPVPNPTDGKAESVCCMVRSQGYPCRDHLTAIEPENSPPELSLGRT